MAPKMIKKLSTEKENQQKTPSDSKSSGSKESANKTESAEVDPCEKFKRYENEGVVVKTKLIGSELVLEPRGDKMCQNSFQRLKAIIKGTNSHKKRIVLKISYDGVKVYDEKTNEILHHHEVSQISYIASDDMDNRTFGYVCDVPNKAHLFICFKTSGPAIEVMSVISALFEAVMEKKNSVVMEKKNSVVIEKKNSADLIGGDSGILDIGDVSFISGFDQNMTTSTSLPKPAPVMMMASSGPVHNRSLVYNHSSVSLSDAALTRQLSYTAPSQIKNENNNSSSIHTDRYAVFNDIDSLPSIFESLGVNSRSNSAANPVQIRQARNYIQQQQQQQQHQPPQPQQQTLTPQPQVNPFDDDFFS